MGANNLMRKCMKSHYKVYDMGRGKSKPAKARHRRAIKRKSYNEFNRDEA